MFFFPNGEWVFSDEYILRVIIGDDASLDPGKKGQLIELKSYSLIMGAYRGETFDLIKPKLLADNHLKADFRTSKVRGTLELIVSDNGQANLKYQTSNLDKNVTRSLWSSRIQDRYYRPRSSLGKNVQVAVSSGEVAGLKKGASVTLGNVYVRDLDVHWEYQYDLVAGGAGVNIGLSPFPESTNYHSFHLDPPCPDWSGSTVSLYTRGVDVVIISLGEKIEIGINLPTGNAVQIVESSAISLTLPSVKADLSTVQLGVLTNSLSQGKPYFGK